MSIVVRYSLCIAVADNDFWHPAFCAWSSSLKRSLLGAQLCINVVACKGRPIAPQQPYSQQHPSEGGGEGGDSGFNTLTPHGPTGMSWEEAVAARDAHAEELRASGRSLSDRATGFYIDSGIKDHGKTGMPLATVLCAIHCN